MTCEGADHLVLIISVYQEISHLLSISICNSKCAPVMGAPIWFHQSIHLRIISPALPLYQLLYLQCLFIFVFKNLLTQKKVGKLMVRKTFFLKWQQALLKTLLQKLLSGMMLQTLKQLYTMKVKSHFHEMIDGFPCPERDNGYSWRISWGYFSSLPRGSCLVASFSEKSRLEAEKMPTLCADIKG